MPHRHSWFAAGLALLLFGAAAGAGEDRPAPLDRVLDALSAAHRFREVALAPDGRTVAWVEALPPREKAPQQHTISVLDLSSPDAAPRRVTAGDGRTAHDEHGLAWSPDGRRLAFLSDAAKEGQLQVYLAPAGGGPARKLTDVKGFLADLRWSPDGRRLAVLWTESATGPIGPTQAAAPETGVIEEAVHEQRLTLLDPESGHPKAISPDDLY